ncbi:MAG: 16S rRNA (guanine(527)-N(7))-methyltransferase RsmG [Gammaproteobacteria bacterium]|nr:16S rRNA (guanine(527)-N(7))-methyltransferase RsmG [Gammaproteobacteria bacterium]MDE2347293.1 16S rRNA (guanine(527)-N(7))-methyltransferase RsmG [Gammaproteobacteria bacterium]
MSDPREIEAVAAGARSLGLTVDAQQAARLLQLLDELSAANAEFNLTAIRDRPGMLHKHLLDSLSVLPYLRGERIADVGTGAGFPGLPLAIASPKRQFVLIEATGKKARYVERTARRVGCVNVEVVHARAESYRPSQGFDVVLARAVAALADFVAHAGHLCAPEGRLFALKGRRPDAEIAALPRTYRVSALHRLQVPGLDEERHLVELCRAAPRSSAK